MEYTEECYSERVDFLNECLKLAFRKFKKDFMITRHYKEEFEDTEWVQYLIANGCSIMPSDDDETYRIVYPSMEVMLYQNTRINGGRK